VPHHCGVYPRFLSIVFVGAPRGLIVITRHAICCIQLRSSLSIIRTYGNAIMYYVNPLQIIMHSLTRKLATMTPPFLFASPDGRGPSSARRIHLRRLYDILHLSIQRGDLLLAQRSFALLSRCEDIEWAAIWKFGLIILAAADHPDQPPGYVNMLGTPKHIEFLRVMMLRHPEERESLVRELVLSLVMAGRERHALDELELCGSLKFFFLRFSALLQQHQL